MAACPHHTLSSAGGSAHMGERKTTETAADEFEEKLHKLIKRAKKQRGMLWPSVISKLELARADVRSMIKVYDSGPK
jgi:hypothetical protein